MRQLSGLLVLVVLLVIGTGHVSNSTSIAPKSDEFAALDRLEAGSNPVILTYNEGLLALVFDSLQKGTGIEIDASSVPKRWVTIDTGKVTVREALVQLAKAADLAYEVVGPNKLVVRAKPAANAD